MDSGPNSEIVYKIVAQYPAQPTDLFSINPKSGQIRTAKSVDYERTSSVFLVVKATGEYWKPADSTSIDYDCFYILCSNFTDQALNVSERLHSTVTVIINIEDINDYSPQFQSRDTVSVAEDEPIGYPLLVVAAKDGDRNSSVRYMIVSGDPENKFTLNSFSGTCLCVPLLCGMHICLGHRSTYIICHLGELTLNGQLDRETNSSYSLRVKAIDTGTPPNHAFQTIQVTVTDVNDHAPRFINSSYTAHVMEEQTGPTEVSNSYTE